LRGDELADVSFINADSHVRKKRQPNSVSEVLHGVVATPLLVEGLHEWLNRGYCSSVDVTPDEEEERTLAKVSFHRATLAARSPEQSRPRK